MTFRAGIRCLRSSGSALAVAAVGLIGIQISAFQSVPTIAAVANAASFTNVVSPGSLVTIFGTNLAGTTAQAKSVPWQTTVAGVTVLINNVAAPVQYVSPTQINLQLPIQTPVGPATATVEFSGASSAPFSFDIATASPGIFSYGTNRAIATNPDGSVNGPSNPVAPGASLTVYITGVGPVNQPIATNAAPPTRPVASSTLDSSATIGNSPATVAFIGLTPGFIGLGQANLQVPRPLPGGDYPIVITLGGVASAAATITVAAGAMDALTSSGTLLMPGTWFSAQVNGNVVYLCGASSIQPISILNLVSPKALTALSITGGTGFICALQGDNLLELTGNSSVSVYSLANPAQPAQIGSATILQNWFTNSIVPDGDTVYFSTDWYSLDGMEITSQHGEFYSYSFVNPAQPMFISQLASNPAVAGSSDLSPRWKAALIDPNTAIIASTTATGGTTNNGTGLAEIVDLTNPASLQVVATVPIPKTAVATGVAVQGGIALLAGNTTGWNNPATPSSLFTGNLTLAAVDVSSPNRPALKDTLIPSPALPTGGAYSVVGIGSGRFAVSVEAPPVPVSSSPTTNPSPIAPGVIGIVDATDPANLVFTQVASVLNPGELGFSNGFLFVIGANGLNIFKVN
jgi:uncharacterized protein (TIGR03437 family)